MGTVVKFPKVIRFNNITTTKRECAVISLQERILDKSIKLQRLAREVAMLLADNMKSPVFEMDRQFRTKEELFNHLADEILAMIEFYKVDAEILQSKSVDDVLEILTYYYFTEHVSKKP